MSPPHTDYAASVEFNLEAEKLVTFGEMHSPDPVQM